ncbi:plant cysteine oxidase 2-like [Oryza brachyantha]|uniref:plant cysteine oxidase 2-like n=1 Tax=Oryza brachyantha TaxID=4533 RepID=UPI001AD9EA83|nr:plant cysteine oxidase 2-like [Oryza brachyantha]
MAGSAPFPVAALDAAFRKEEAEGQGTAPGKESSAAAAAPKTLTESGSPSTTPTRAEQQVAAGKKRKRGPTDEGSPSREEGAGDDDDEPPVVSVPQAVQRQVAVPPRRQSALQLLVNECRVLLDGSESAPPPTTVSRILALFNGIGPDDIRLDTEFDASEVTRAAARSPTPVIGGKYMYECEKFTVAIFYLPPGTVMPLHDHPGMTVFSKLLAGSAHVQSFDWVSPAVHGNGANRPVRSSTTRLAKRVLDHDVAAGCGTWVLYPSSGGNLHRFIAGGDEPCAFLDVLTPPYSLGPRRQCTFYRDYPFDLHPNHHAFGRNLSDEEKSQFSWLRPMGAGMLPDLNIIPLTYSGPEIL